MPAITVTQNQELVASYGRALTINHYHATADLEALEALFGTANAVRFAERIIAGEELSVNGFRNELAAELEAAAEERDGYGDPREANELRHRARKLRDLRDLSDVERSSAKSEPSDDELMDGEYLADHAHELTPAQLETAADLVASWNPHHAIEGWASGCEAEGRDVEAGIYRRALAIQDGELRSEPDVEAAVDAVVAKILELVPPHEGYGTARREVVRRVAERFGLNAIDESSDALEQAAEELGLDLERRDA